MQTRLNKKEKQQHAQHAKRTEIDKGLMRSCVSSALLGASEFVSYNLSPINSINNSSNNLFKTSLGAP
jgi:hypothetical protein